jgi:hypothetical protein
MPAHDSFWSDDEERLLEASVRAKEANDRSKEKSDESKHGKELYQNGWRDPSSQVIDFSVGWGFGEPQRYLNKLRRLLSKSDESDRKLLLQMAQKMVIRQPRKHELA